MTVWDYDRSSSNDFLGEVSIFRLWAPCLEMSKTLSIDLTRRLATAAAAALLIYFYFFAMEQPLFIQADMILLICLHPMIMDVSFCFMPVNLPVNFYIIINIIIIMTCLPPKVFATLVFIWLLLHSLCLCFNFVPGFDRLVKHSSAGQHSSLAATEGAEWEHRAKQSPPRRSGPTRVRLRARTRSGTQPRLYVSAWNGTRAWTWTGSSPWTGRQWSRFA